MKYENICTRKTYEQNGETKTVWLRCGTLRTTDDNKRFIELNHLPNIAFYIFAPKPKEEQDRGEAF